MLTAEQQRFLVDHYGLRNTARTFADPASAKLSWAGSYSAKMGWQTCKNGIAWANPGEEHGFEMDIRKWPNRITWAELRSHVAEQPASLIARLREHLDACRAEERRHWEARHAISPNGYGDTRPEVHAALRAEDDAHRVTARALDALVADIARKLLPLATNEPADLIEWAEVLAPETSAS